MAYGTPVESGNREYALFMTSVTPVGEYLVNIQCTATTDDSNSEGLETVFQQFVDLIGDGGDHFTVYPTSATRIKHTTEYVTPTP